MRKGDLVRFNKKSSGFIRETRRGMTPSKTYRASRPSTPEERSSWREALNAEIAAAKPEDRFGIACDSAGESRLAPRSVTVSLNVDGVFIVERARCRVSLGWGRPVGGLAKIVDPESGQFAYVKREVIEVINER